MRNQFVPCIKRLMCAALFAAVPLTAAAQSAPGGAASKVPAAGGAPYVDSKAIKERFKEITAEDMEALRGKKILLASRSFGLNLVNGLKSVATKDKKYELLSSYVRYDVFKVGGDLSVIPADAFEKKNFVHFLASYWPHTTRVVEVDTLLRKPPHDFGKSVDFVIIFFHTAIPGNFEQYAGKMDAMQKDFPKARFIYVTAGFMGKEKAKENENAHAWSEKVRERYQGKAPLYDMGKILSDDFRSGHAYAPEYSTDVANVHPNTDEGQSMLAKGFLLVLRDALHWDAAKAPKLEPIAETTRPAAAVAALAPGSADYKAVRAILDANALTKKDVNAVSVVEKGRVVKLYLQEGGVKELPDAIGTLTELRLLHVYGDRKLGHPLLEKISPAIGKCTKLEELLLNSNDLTTLPKEITGLTKLKALSVGDNRLKDLPAEVKEWVEKVDKAGLSQQAP